MIETLGQKIQKIRMDRGLSRTEFGKLVLDANRSLVSKWESDRSMPKIERLHVIASLGGMTVTQLLQSTISSTQVPDMDAFRSVQTIRVAATLLEDLKSSVNIVATGKLNEQIEALNNISELLQRMDFDNIQNAIVTVQDYLKQLSNEVTV